MTVRRLATAFTCGLIASALTGCDEDEPIALTACQEAAQSPIMVQLGSGTDDFEPVDDGGYLPVVRGVQGGAHAWVGVQVTGFHPGNALDPASAPIIEWQAWDAEDRLVGDGFSYDQLTEAGDVHELAGAMMFVDMDYASWHEEEPPAEETVRMRVTIEDTCGTRVEHELDIYLGNRSAEYWEQFGP